MTANNRSVCRLACVAMLALVLAPLGSALAADDGAGDYTLTRQYGSVFFRVFHQEFLTLVGRFDNYSGTLRFDPDNLANSQLTASVDMGSLNMADGDVTETLVNSSVWFNASVFPQATFTSTSTVVTGDNTVDFVGDLTFLGMSKPWTLQATFHGGSDGELAGSTVGMSARGVINRLDFGMDQYRNMAADDVEIEVNVKFNRN